MGRVRLTAAYEVRAKLQSLLFATKAREAIAGFLPDGKCWRKGAGCGSGAIGIRSPPCYRNRETNITTALFSIRLHFVRRERIGIVQISASQFLTTRLRRTLSKIAKVYPRHCERSEAIHVSTCGPTDCFAALAMASRSRSPDERS